MHVREGVVRRAVRAGLACGVGVAGVGLWAGLAPAAAADPGGVFLCVKNASSKPVGIEWNLNRGTEDPGGRSLAPGSRRCAESTPWLRLVMIPGTDKLTGTVTWGVFAEGTTVQVAEGWDSFRSFVTVQTRASWSQVGVGDTRRATVPPPGRLPGGDWKFTLQRFPNDEHVGGGKDTSGNRWIRYLLTIKES